MYQVILHQLYEQKEMSNVFFYRPATGTGTAQEVLDGFVTDVLPAINGIQENDVITNRLIQVLHLFDLADFVEDTVSGGGVRAGGGSMPSFVAVNYTLRVNTRAVRAGKKRFSGVGESYVQKGIVTDATYIGHLQALKTELGSELVGASATYKPCVVKRIFVEATPTAKAHYRLPEVVGELEYGDVTTVLVNLTCTTQNSRKS